MDYLAKKLATSHDMLDAARIMRKSESDLSVEMLREYLGVSRTTADKYFSELSGEKDGIALLCREERNVGIHAEKACFLGISIGSSRIRVVLLDLNFDEITCEQIESRFGISRKEMSNIKGLECLDEKKSETSFVYKTPYEGGFEALRDGISNLVSVFIEQARTLGKEAFPLAAIGFAVSGPVNYQEKVWCYAPRLGVRNLTVLDLIGYSNYSIAINQLGLFFSLDNNAKAAMISEYQFLLERYQGCYTKDIALIYIGQGVSSAAVIGQKLLRASNNLSGELGHVVLLICEKEGSPLKAYTIEELFKGDEVQNSSHYAKFMPYVLKMINCILGIDKFILAGHSNEDFATLGSELMAERFRFTVASTQQYCEKEDGRNDPNTDAIGAAIEAYFCLCQSGGVTTERINLSNDIIWKVRAN